MLYVVGGNRFAAEKVSENKLGDVGPQLPVDPTILAVCVFPFIPLCLYALFTVALSTIVGYLFFLLLYLLVLVGTPCSPRPLPPMCAQCPDDDLDLMIVMMMVMLMLMGSHARA
jgi:hypothetical protein